MARTVAEVKEIHDIYNSPQLTKCEVQILIDEIDRLRKALIKMSHDHGCGSDCLCGEEDCASCFVIKILNTRRDSMSGKLMVDAQTWDAQNKCLRDYEDDIKRLTKEKEVLKAEVEKIGKRLTDTAQMFYKAEQERDRLRESNKAMEKMLCRVGKVAGVKNGDAEGLVSWLEAQKEDNAKKERSTLEGVDFAIKVIVGNVVCDKPTVRAICQGIKSHFNLNHKEV